MNKRLNQAWASLGHRVVDSLGKNRRVVDKHGVTVCKGGYQSEIVWLQFNNPASLNVVGVR